MFSEDIHSPFPSTLVHDVESILIHRSLRDSIKSKNRAVHLWPSRTTNDTTSPDSCNCCRLRHGHFGNRIRSLQPVHHPHGMRLLLQFNDSNDDDVLYFPACTLWLGFVTERQGNFKRRDLHRNDLFCCDVGISLRPVRTSKNPFVRILRHFLFWRVHRTESEFLDPHLLQVLWWIYVSDMLLSKLMSGLVIVHFPLWTVPVVHLPSSWLTCLKSLLQSIDREWWSWLGPHFVSPIS